MLHCSASPPPAPCNVAISLARLSSRATTTMSMLLLLSGASALVAGPAGGRAALSPVARGRRMAPVAAAAATASSPLDFGVFKSQPTTRVEGDTLKTWDVGATTTERVQLSLQSTGRPIKSDVQLWTTPSYIPAKFSVYTEDGNLRPIHAVIETPVHPKTVAVYNTNAGEFPFEACVADTGLGKAKEALAGFEGTLVQGGAIRSYTFGAETASVAVLLSSSELGERNMKAMIELTSGPNQVKQYFEIYCSSGYKNPFYAVIQTPDPATTIRVINQNTVEFPFEAKVVECDVADAAGSQPEMGGGSFSGGLLR